MGGAREIVRRLVALDRGARARLIAGLAAEEARAFERDWPAWVHKGQEAPEGADWRVWVMLAGRGFGKTRAGAEWILEMARTDPVSLGADGPLQIALVAATVDEARRVMIEGNAGLLAAAPPWERAKMRWQPSRRLLTFASGAEARLFSGAHGDSLRGPEHHFAWCDELAKWRQAGKAWDNLMLGLRLGDNPRALVTTTPRPIAALKAIIADSETALTGGATAANPHVSPRFVASMERQHRGTRLGRQELDGEWIGELEGALWSRALIEACRVLRYGLAGRHAPGMAADCRRQSAPANSPSSAPTQDERSLLRKVVVGVDPPAGPAGTCGIVVCGVRADGVGLVLADMSATGLSPEGWARKVAAAAETWRAHRVVAEANNGGKMVETVLRGAALGLPLKLVHAADGKVARAAPVSALFESGLAKFAGAFPALEDELCGLTWGGGYQGPGRSPDRADAMVWALSELLLGRPAAEPRVRGL